MSAATTLFWRWRFFIAGFLGGCVGSLLAGWRGSATAVVTIILGLLASEWRRP